MTEGIRGWVLASVPPHLGDRAAHLPVMVVAVAGGWTDLNTLMECYRQPDRNSLLSVMSGAKPVTEQAIVR